MTFCIKWKLSRNVTVVEVFECIYFLSQVLFEHINQTIHPFSIIFILTKVSGKLELIPADFE